MAGKKKKKKGKKLTPNEFCRSLPWMEGKTVGGAGCSEVVKLGWHDVRIHLGVSHKPAGHWLQARSRVKMLGQFL